MLGYRVLDYSLRHDVPKQFPVLCLLMRENGLHWPLVPHNMILIVPSCRTSPQACFRFLPLRARRLSTPAAADLFRESLGEEATSQAAGHIRCELACPFSWIFFRLVQWKKRMFALTQGLFLSSGLGGLHIERVWSL